MRVLLICLVCLVALAGCGGGGAGTFGGLAPTAIMATSPSPVTRGAWFTAACSYADANGATDLKDCKFGITPTNNHVSFKYVRNENRLYAYNSATLSWAPAGGVQPGTDTTIEATDAILDCASTTVTVAANTVVVNYRLQLKPAMTADTYGLSLSCNDLGGLSTGVGWVNFGQVVVE